MRIIDLVTTGRGRVGLYDELGRQPAQGLGMTADADCEALPTMLSHPVSEAAAKDHEFLEKHA